MMFRKCLLATLLFIFLYDESSGQSLTVDTYANQLLFNVFRDQPDAAIRDFLKLYIPSMLDKKTTAQPSAENKFTLESHGFVFLQHPHFVTPFRNGKLEFDCRKYNDARGVQVDDVRLWFNFDTQADGESAFGKMVESFRSLSPNNRIYSANGAMIGEFTDIKNKQGFNKVQIFLTADTIDRTKFKLLFALGNSLP